MLNQIFEVSALRASGCGWRRWSRDVSTVCRMRVRSPLSTFSTHFPGIEMKAGSSPMLLYYQGENVTRTLLLAVRRIQQFDTNTAMW